MTTSSTFAADAELRDTAFRDYAFRDTAWGAEPGRWPLPSATEPSARWHRAVALAGQGRYSLASAELDAAARQYGTTASLRSLVLSTRASWLRQMGSHDAASRFDGMAIALVGTGTSTESLDTIEARCDALTGLGADALGVGRFGVADAVFSRCERQLLAAGNARELWRQRLRVAWVRAELEMVAGNGAQALRHALDARELATDTVSLRHRTKTELILAAAHCAVGDTERSLVHTNSVLDACSEHGLVPLRWAAAMLLGGLGEVTTASPLVAECVTVLRSRGGFVAGA